MKTATLCHGPTTVKTTMFIILSVLEAFSVFIHLWNTGLGVVPQVLETGCKPVFLDYKVHFHKFKKFYQVNKNPEKYFNSVVDITFRNGSISFFPLKNNSEKISKCHNLYDNNMDSQRHQRLSRSFLPRPKTTHIQLLNKENSSVINNLFER